MEMMQSGGMRLRSYQQEMLEASLQRNTIVVMDTGSGKTIVAASRILAELERSVTGKAIWLLVPNVALAQQHYGRLSDLLPAYHVLLLTGNDGVEKWSEQKLWDLLLKGVSLVICTPAVLLDALTHGFIKIEEIPLLVFDEAHRCTKNSPMSKLMRDFYHPAKSHGRSTPHILGLTASPVVNAKQKNIALIEANLDAVIVTPIQHRAELGKYVHRPQLTKVEFEVDHAASLHGTGPLCSALTMAVAHYNISTDPYVLDLESCSDDKSSKALAKIYRSRKTFCFEQLVSLEIRAATVREQLGPTMAEWYLTSCIQKFQKCEVSVNPLFHDLTDRERDHLAKIFESIVAQGKNNVLESQPIITCYKAQALVATLLSSASTSMRGIIFVEQRAVTTAMCHLLNNIPEIAAHYNIGSFVGTSANTSRKIRVADLVELKQQQSSLAEFRDGSKNLIIATNVLEEGIDVSACNFVISYDPPQNLVSFVQRRGRARQADSTNIIFLPKDDLRANVQDWAALEAEMVEMYVNADVERLDEMQTQEDLAQRDSYRVPSTGALLTHENAQAHLHHFCQVGVSQATDHVDLRPEYSTIQDESTKLWSASVTLPSYVHPSLRHAESEQSWHTERSAIYDAAFQAYVNLHENGLVNDNLLPLFKDNRPEEGQMHLDQPSIKEVSERRPVWWAACDELRKPEVMWSRSIIEISGPEGCLVTMSMWTPERRPTDETFQLHWDDMRTYTVSVHASDGKSLENCAEIAATREITKLLLRAVYGDKVSPERDDFPAIFAPVNCDDLHVWLSKRQQNPRQLDISSLRPREEWGLLRSRRIPGRSFFLRNFTDASQTTDTQVQVKVFPKRRDFLHAVANLDVISADETVKHTLYASECTMDVLEAKYSQFAAFIPCIMHRVDVNLLVDELCTTILRDLALKDTSLVLEAISSPPARESTDYNRLEYLGDCLLKHITEVQLMTQHRSWPENYLTEQKDRIVCNKNLSKAALNARLDHFILTKIFTGNKWRPIYAGEVLAETTEQKRSMSTKVLADVMEALIGAAYVDGGLNKAHACIQLLLPEETWWPMDRCFSGLVEGLSPCDISDLRPLERLIGHTFRYPSLLVEATTHVSFQGSHTGMSYERLEFLGDSVLDVIITPKLFAHASKLKHWQLHGVHEALVNSHFLGFCCLRYATEDEVFVVVNDHDAEGLPMPDLQPSTRQLHLYDFMRASSIFAAYRIKAVAAFETLRRPIEDALSHGYEYPWCDLVALSPHKFFCDLVESIIGALYIDSGGDLRVCEAFVKRLGILDFMQHMLDHGVKTLSPKERMGIVADQGKVKYVNSLSEDKLSHTCTVNVDDEKVFTVEGCGNKVEAEVKAAYYAAKIWENRQDDQNRRKRRLKRTEDTTMHAEI